MVFAFIISLSVAIMALLISRMFNTSTHQTNYYVTMDRTYRLAESGMNAAVGQMVNDPLTVFDGSWVAVPSEDGWYRNLVEKRNLPVPNISYIVTTATRVVNGAAYSSQLHTYVRMSNVSEYFAAVKASLSITNPVNISGGKVYANK
jgi:hypothetical protein